MPQLGAAGPGCPRQHTPTIATVLEKLQSALQKSRIDRATTRPTAGRAGAEHWYGAVYGVRVGRPSVVWLCGLEMDGVQYAPRWL